MLYNDFHENWKIFSELRDKLINSQNEQIRHLLSRYIDLNIAILNDVFSISIENLKKLQDIKTPNDIICTQACLTQEVIKKLTLSSQRFLTASLGNIADYNEWIKAHCDLATD